MEAYRLIRHGPAEGAFALQEVPLPEPAAGELLIKVEGFGLNFADVMARLGLYQDAPPLPSILGYEVVGTVEDPGEPDSSRPHSFKKGDRVVAMTRFGGYARYVSASALACARISERVGIEEACALATQFTTAYFAAESKVRMSEGDRVLIHAAAGGVGTALVQLARRRGCTIIGTVGSDSKKDRVRSLGAHHVINYRTHDFKVETEKLFGERPLDYVFDSIGGDTFKKGYQLLAPTGTIVGFGAAENAKPGLKLLNGLRLLKGFGLFSPVQLLMQSRSIIGVNLLRVADHRPLLLKRTLEEVVDLHERGEIRPVGGGVFPAHELAKAHAWLESRNSVGKIAVVWG